MEVHQRQQAFSHAPDQAATNAVEVARKAVREHRDLVPNAKLGWEFLLDRAGQKTIGAPFEGSTRGTWLGNRGRFPEDQDPPSFEIRKQVFRELVPYSENRYVGAYHTDQTIPSAYFDPQIGDLAGGGEQELFFTYLHSPRDEGYLTMGTGTLARTIEEEEGMSQTQGGSEP